MKAIGFIKDLVKKFPFLLMINTILVFFVGVTEATTIFTISPLIDFFVSPENTSPLTKRIMAMGGSLGISVTLNVCLAIFVGFIILSSALRILAKFWIEKTRYALLEYLMLGTFKNFLSARLYFFTSGKVGTFLNTFVREMGYIGAAFDALSFLFAGSMQLLFYLAIPLLISWQVTLVSLIAALFFVVPLLLLGKLSYRWGKITTATGNEMTSVLEENMRLSKLVLGFGNQERSFSDLKKTFDVFRSASVKSATMGASMPVLYQPCGAIVLIVTLFTAQKLGIAFSEIAVLLLAMLRAIMLIGNLAFYRNRLDNCLPSYEQVKDLNQKSVEMKQESGSRPFTGFAKEVNVENVSFAYPGCEPVLSNIRLVVPKGHMIAIVGKSGSGKSTLVDMIMGFHQPVSGKITFDGVPLREYDVISYRHKIGYVPQDSVLFNMSVRDNLLWAKPNVTQEDLNTVCKLAYVDDFVSQLQHGYDTIVGDRGVRLSGGQIQRVALARALLCKPELLILDEATSSLDTHSERLIQLAIDNVVKETTVIVVAHRLSTIKNADCIYVLQNGKIVESGSYEQLIKNNDHFNQMVSPQILKAEQ